MQTGFRKIIWGFTILVVQGVWPTSGAPTNNSVSPGMGGGAAGHLTDQPWRLWYRQPAELTNWTAALPVGNGRLGVMVFGGVGRERLQLNEDTLWAGGPYDPANPEAQAALPKVRSLIFDGQYAKAHRNSRVEHHTLQTMGAFAGNKIEVCGIAMERSAIAPGNVIPCAVVERNVFVNAVALQNRGYAYMPIA